MRGVDPAARCSQVSTGGAPPARSQVRVLSISVESTHDFFALFGLSILARLVRPVITRSWVWLDPTMNHIAPPEGLEATVYHRKQYYIESE